jgi:ankyrin repeat protein
MTTHVRQFDMNSTQRRKGAETQSMKTFNVFLLAVMFALNVSAADVFTEKLQRGLFEEEANHNLDAAIKEYQSITAQSDEQRKIVATALFRLGECYRKLGKTNEANAQYRRILRDFSEQEQLVKLSRDVLNMAGTAETNLAVNTSGATDEEEKEVRRIRAMIKDSPDLINARIGGLGGFGGAETPLHRATSAGQLVVTRFLLSNNADVNAKNAQGETPLHLAAARGHKSMVELLLDNRAEVNATSGSGTPLHLAALNGFRAVAEVLLAHQADVNAKTINGQTPLCYAAASGHKAVCELLLDKGGDVSTATSTGSRALDLAAEVGQKPVVELLLARGASVNAKRSDGSTPLSLAVGKKNIPITETLLASKADPNIANAVGVTPLYIAAKDKSAELVSLLLAHGADPNLADRHQMTPLHWASLHGEAGMVEALLKSKASPEAKIAWAVGEAPTYRTPRQNYETTVPNGATPLWFAISYRFRPVVELLLSHGAPINDPITVASGGSTHSSRPLEIAIGNYDKEMVKLLLERKADPNVLSLPNKWTPLMTASANRSREIVEFLLAHGAEVNVLSEGGHTALSLAQNQFGSSPPSAEIAELLRAHGAIEDLQRSSSLTLARAARRFAVFEKDTNGFNRFTLFETIAMHYATAQDPQRLHFPDFSRVKVKRLKAPAEELNLDLDTAFKFNDCTKDQWLEWGDLVEIPEQDHKVNENWLSLSQEATSTLNKCLDRKVRIIVKGQTNIVSLSFGLTTPQPGYGRIPGLPAALPGSRPVRPDPLLAIEKPADPEIELNQFRLNDVVRGANVIRSSSDLTRVKVKRADPVTRERRELNFDLTKVTRRDDLWLRDGDVIEIPEKP